MKKKKEPETDEKRVTAKLSNIHSTVNLPLGEHEEINLLKVIERCKRFDVTYDETQFTNAVYFRFEHIKFRLSKTGKVYVHYLNSIPFYWGLEAFFQKLWDDELKHCVVKKKG